MPVLFCFGGDGKLGDLLWGLIAANVFSLAFYVEYERMLCLLVVKPRVIPFASTAAIEAVEADVQTIWVIDTVEALCAVLTVDTLGGCGCAELYMRLLVGELGECSLGKSYRSR